MKITYDVKITAQSDLGREYSVIQTIEYDNGDIVRNNLYTSPYKTVKGLLDCNKVMQSIKVYL